MGASVEPGPRTLTVPGDGVRLVADRWPGASPAVLLLHGLASQRHFWGPVARRLTAVPGGPTVVALDQRGHGDSDRPASGYDHDTVVADAITVLDALGLSRVVVVGHSWGAWTAMALAAAHPDRVLALVAVDGGFARPGDGVGRAQMRERMTPPRFSLPADDLPARLAAGPLARWWSAELEQAVMPIFEVGDDGLARPRFPLEAHMQVVDDLLDADPADWAPRVTCPAWLVAAEPVGGSDPARVAALERTGSLLADGRILRWAGAVHDVPLQWPDLVAGLVRTARAEVSG